MESLHLNNKEVADVELTDVAGTGSPHAAKVFDDHISHVPDRFKGTNADQRDMIVMGKTQVLRVGIPFKISTVEVLTVCSETSLS